MLNQLLSLKPLNKTIVTTIRSQRLHLHPFKAIFWEDQSILFLADLHLGKTAHFRKAGIAVPKGVADANWDRLMSLLLDYQPKRVIFLGDLFHSDYNQACEEMVSLIDQFNMISFELVMGNHDVLDESYYRVNGLKKYEPPLVLEPFVLSHYPMDPPPEGLLNLAGHIHPSVRLFGTARQRLRLPCFYFGNEQALLPAFGGFTGTATIQPGKSDQVFVIVEDQVIEVDTSP